MNPTVKDPAVYFIRTLLLRPARETAYRVAPLYRIFEAWRSLTGLAGYRPQPEMQPLLERGGGRTHWNEAGSLQSGSPGEEWRWRARVDTVGDDACLFFGIETRRRLPAPADPQAGSRDSLLRAERDRLRARWLSMTGPASDAVSPLLARVGDAAADASQLRTTGEAWLFSFEWTADPVWEELARARFPGGSWLLFDWGLLGIEDADGLPIFEAHVSATIPDLARYENFIFKFFPEFLLYFLKVPQLLAGRYQRSQTPRARALDAELSAFAQSLSRSPGRRNLRQAEAALEQIAARLGEFRTVLAEIAIDRHTAQIDYQNAGDILRDHLPQDNGQIARFLRPLKIYLEQAEKDLEYYRLTLDAVVQTMDLVKLQTELLRVRFTNVLAAIGAGFGIFLGLGQLIDANYLKDFLQRRCPWFPLSPYGNSARAAICLLLAGAASLIVYGLLNRFIATSSNAAGSRG